MQKAKKQDRITHISRVVFEGYKSIDHLEIDLVKGLNILIGPNGSGKSNFLSLLDSVFNSISLLNPNLHEYYESAEIFMVKKNIQKIRWYTERRFDAPNVNTKSEFAVEYVYMNNKKIEDSEEILRVKTNGIFIPIIFVKYNLPNPTELIVIDKPGEVIFYKRNNSFQLAKQPGTQTGRFLYDFIFDYFLHTPVNKIQFDRDIIYNSLIFPDSIKLNLKKFSPIQDIRFSPNINIYEDENRASIENIILEFFVEGQWMPWSYLSDGTKRLFYLISEISYFENAIILIEEPELGVHPDQFHLIMNFLKEQAEDKQIIISTHSPEALNIFSEDELNHIIVTKYDKKKGTTMAHLGAKQIAKAKVYMKKVGFLSDYWLQSDLEG